MYSWRDIFSGCCGATQGGNNYSQFFLSNFIAKGSLPFCCSILEEIRFKSLKHSTILSGSQFVLFFIFNWTKQSFQVKKPVPRYQMSPDFVVKCQNELNYLLSIKIDLIIVPHQLEKLSFHKNTTNSCKIRLVMVWLHHFQQDFG